MEVVWPHRGHSRTAKSEPALRCIQPCRVPGNTRVPQCLHTAHLAATRPCASRCIGTGHMIRQNGTVAVPYRA